MSGLGALAKLEFHQPLNTAKLENNKVYHDLIGQGLIAPERLEVFSNKTRDANIRVFRDKVSEIIFLEEIRTSREHYSKKKVSEYRAASRAITQTSTCAFSSSDLHDSNRRFDQFKDYFRDKNVCDFGAGQGYFLECLSGHAKSICGVELEIDSLRSINDRCGDNVRVATDIDALDDTFDVVTMFHVLEHIEDQVAALSRIRRNMVEGGLIIIEVPHARDILLDGLRVQNFVDFTLWSEHLILHTRESLSTFVKAAGFTNVVVTGFQRYGLSNHLYWLKYGKPGGHEKLIEFTRPDLDQSYASMLKDVDKTDTLICIAEN